MDPYTASFVDPFSTAVPQPKILDGAIDRSSGVRFRTTGTVTLDAAAGDNFFVLFPGLGNSLLWKKPADANWLTHAPFPAYLDTTAYRADVRKARVVSTGLRLTLMNSSDDNEGYWEAVRVPTNPDSQTWELIDSTAPTGEDYLSRLKATVSFSNLSNYPTFQTGRLRDLERFLFKLNSTEVDHPFTDIRNSADTGFPVQIDSKWDMVVIRLVGRVNATTPSVVQYDVVSNFEVIYKQDTPMARLATPNVMVPEMSTILDRTRFLLPAIQVS